MPSNPFEFRNCNRTRMIKEITISSRVLPLVGIFSSEILKVGHGVVVVAAVVGNVVVNRPINWDLSSYTFGVCESRYMQKKPND